MTLKLITSVLSGEGNGNPLQYSRLENPRDGGAWWAAVHGVAKSRTQLSDFTLFFPFHALEKEMATHSSVLAWRIPGTGEPGGLPSLGSHRVGHDGRDFGGVAAAAAAANSGSGGVLSPPRGRSWALQWTFNFQGFPGGSDGEVSACKAGNLGLIPGLGRSPEEGNGYPLQYSWLENAILKIITSVLLPPCGKSWALQWTFNFQSALNSNFICCLNTA